MRRLALAILLLPPALALAETIDPPREYRTCLALARSNPEHGWEEALAWQSLGGGEAARHCGAVALIGLGKHEEAATRLEAMAQESRRSEPVRAEMLAQAAQAWLLAGRVERALAALDTGLQLVPNAPELLLDKAVALAQAHHYAKAADLLSTLLNLQPNRVEALTLRASAYRYLDRLELAREDVARALVLDSQFPDALLERGMLRRLAGDTAAAREDWMKVLAQSPEGAAADAARRNIELMDVKAK